MTSALWSIFWILAVITLITSLAFIYHWSRFSPTHTGAITSMVIYLIGATLLLGSLVAILSTL